MTDRDDTSKCRPQLNLGQPHSTVGECRPMAEIPSQPRGIRHCCLLHYTVTEETTAAPAEEEEDQDIVRLFFSIYDEYGLDLPTPPGL